jgi:hypothetical protein
MMNENMISIVMELLNLSREEVEKNHKELHEINAFYFWNNSRGGKSIIINEFGEKLIASSIVSFEEHLQAFVDGKRN